MGRLIPVPGTYRGYGFPQLAAGADESIVDTLLPLNTPTFPFWKYLLLSITAGVSTHYIIRALEKKR